MNTPFVLCSTVTEYGAVRALGNQALLLFRFISVGSRSYATEFRWGFLGDLFLDYIVVPTPVRNRGLLAAPIFLTFGGPTEIRFD